jgi:SAM-dependent methyltransferase
LDFHQCRFCSSQLKKIFVDLGTTPLSNSFLKSQNLDKPEKKFPLKVFVCEKCLLVQVPEFETPNEIFSDYAYFSSYSKSWLKHAEKYADMIIKKNHLTKNSLVIEIASNDGYLLQFFKKREIQILGIEPAANVAKVAIDNGIKTLIEFFGEKLAKKISNENTKADLIIGNNVLAHVPNINDFIKGMSILLKSEGTINMEFPHLLQLIKNKQFDTIYHEHFSYFSLSVVKKIFEFHNLTIFDVEEISTHGGSLRIYVKHQKNNKIKIEDSVNHILNSEEKFGMSEINTYLEFSEKIKHLKKEIKKFFKETKVKKKKVICYGAAAKGNTLLNYCQIGKENIEFVVDNNQYKQGLYLPGSHLQIKDPNKILEVKPDFVFILPWNIKNEIMDEIEYIRDWGGKFVIAIPEIKIE